jgi:hypothetical protein
MGVAEVIAFARQQIGKPYVFGATGPNSYDCSGLVVAAFKHGANKTLPHYTGTLVTLGTAVAKKDLQPGDLVFPDSGHVQIYTGDGRVVEAPHTGAYVQEVAMWGFWRARRMNGVTGTVAATTVADTSGAANALLPDSINTAIGKLTEESTWVLTGMYVAGALLVLIGLVLMVVNATPGVSNVAQLAAKVAA